MDIWCSRCGEPLDLDTLHDVPGMTFAEARDAFYAGGCEGLVGLGLRCNPEPDRMRASVAAALGDLLGDDVDGFASELDDFDALHGGRW